MTPYLAEPEPPWVAESPHPRLHIPDLRASGHVLAVAADRRLVWLPKDGRTGRVTKLLLTSATGLILDRPLLNGNAFHFARLSAAILRHITKTLGTSWRLVDLDRRAIGLSRTLVWTEEVRFLRQLKHSAGKTTATDITERDNDHVQGRSPQPSFMGGSNHAASPYDDHDGHRDGFSAGGAYDAHW